MERVKALACFLRVSTRPYLASKICACFFDAHPSLFLSHNLLYNHEI